MLRKLNEEDLNNVNGGYIHDTHNIIMYKDWQDHLFEVIDDNTGDVLHVAHSYEEALKVAKEKGVCSSRIDDYNLQRLRDSASGK